MNHHKLVALLLVLALVAIHPARALCDMRFETEEQSRGNGVRLLMYAALTAGFMIGLGAPVLPILAGTALIGALGVYWIYWAKEIAAEQKVRATARAARQGGLLGVPMKH